MDLTFIHYTAAHPPLKKIFPKLSALCSCLWITPLANLNLSCMLLKFSTGVVRLVFVGSPYSSELRLQSETDWTRGVELGALYCNVVMLTEGSCELERGNDSSRCTECR